MICSRSSFALGQRTAENVTIRRGEYDELRADDRAKLYELGRLSSGQAAKLCGKGRVDFLLSLPRVGVSISNLQPEDTAAEVRFLQRAHPEIVRAVLAQVGE